MANREQGKWHSRYMHNEEAQRATHQLFLCYRHNIGDENNLSMYLCMYLCMTLYLCIYSCTLLFSLHRFQQFYTTAKWLWHAHRIAFVDFLF